MSKYLLFAILATLITPTVHAGEPVECHSEDACLDVGARVFRYRCSLCHGETGEGDGVLATTIGNNAESDLLHFRYADERKGVTQFLQKGANGHIPNSNMPAWEGGISTGEIKSLALFIEQFHTDYQNATALIQQQKLKADRNRRSGQALYKDRCRACHGKSGKGDGHLAAIIKDPPPTDLTRSRASYQFLKQIISNGGAAVNRSSKMPAWGVDLTDTEINNIIRYIKKLRRKK